MGRTMIEKILAKHSNDRCRPGDIVWIDIDNRTARDFAGASVVGNLEKYGGDIPIENTDKTFFTFDCNVPANTIPYADNQHRIRLFARKQNLKVYDVDAGIGSHVAIEEKYAQPGTTTVGTDSHLNIMGAVGAFGQGMGDVDIAFAFKTGKVWFQVPSSVKITLNGIPPEGTEAKDIALFLLGRFNHHELLGKSVEIYGKWVEKASVADCITLSSLATEMGAIIALIPPNDNVLAYFGKTRDQASYADEGAEYEVEYELETGNLSPMIAAPPNPNNVHPVAEMTDVRVDGVFIGSCTNGTYQDMRYTAELLRGKKVKPGVMLKVVPATRKTWARMVEEGLIADIFNAGGIISNAGCGGCASGQIGMTGRGEVQVSTSNRNFTGKQGMGNTYLAGIGTAVASAILGRIASIHELKGVK